MRRTRWLAQLLAAALLLALLPATASAQSVFPYDAGDIEGKTWRLTSYAADGTLTAVPADVTATLLLEAGSASGAGGCNTFSGTYEIEPLSPWIISFDDAIVRTEMFCEGPGQEVEEAFLALLPTIISWTIIDDALQLNDPSESPVLVFADDTAETGTSELDAVLAAIDALRARIDALDERVARIESGGESGDRAAKKPKRPRSRGKIKTRFPVLDPDPTQGLVRWIDRSDDESGFIVTARRRYCALKRGADPNQQLEDTDFRVARGETVEVARLAADSERFEPVHADIEALLPEKPASPYSDDQLYDLFVSAFNDAGSTKPRLVGSYFLQPEFRCP